MLDKILEESNFDIDLAVIWSVNAKNYLTNIHGSSPYQLAIGTNPKFILSTILNIGTDIQKFTSNSESKWGIYCQWKLWKIETIKCLTDNSASFKYSKSWHGPAKVLRQDGQHVLIKNWNRYIRVHPCHLQLINPSNVNISSDFTQPSQDT